VPGADGAPADAEAAAAAAPRPAKEVNKRPGILLRCCLPDRERGYAQQVSIGTSIFMIAVGAILKYAVTANVSGVDIQTVGVILMLVGILGLILSLLYTFVWSNPNRRTGPPPNDYDQPTRRY
jgi:hypothetical protein